MTDRFSQVDGSEKAVLTFDFTRGLESGETLISPTVEVAVVYGTDLTPTITGTPVVSGASVLVPVSGMEEGVDYRITVTCTTSNTNKTLVLAGVLPVRPA